MKTLMIAGAATLIGISFGEHAAIAIGVGICCAFILVALLGKRKVVGATAGVGLGIIVFGIVSLGAGNRVRCDFGDPVDLPTLNHPAGYVYVIQDVAFSKLYKIGRTNNPARRLSEIRNILPGKSEIVAIVDTKDAPALEWQLQQRYAAERRKGEWFALRDNDVREICRI